MKKVKINLLDVSEIKEVVISNTHLAFDCKSERPL